MILHRERKRIIPQAHLLDDIVSSAPRLDFETVRDAIDRLVMRAVYFFESMVRGRIVTQRLNILLFLVGVLVIRNVELKRAAERDVQDLDTSANAEDRQTTRDGLRNRIELPAVPRRIDIFEDQARISNFLAQKFRGDIRPARQQQSVHLVHRNVAGARIENTNVRMLGKKWLKPFFILRAHPRSKVGHWGINLKQRRLPSRRSLLLDLLR